MGGDMIRQEAEGEVCLEPAPVTLHPPTTTTSTDGALTVRSISLERKSDLKRSWVLIMAFLLTEVVKQLSNYGMARANGGALPLPSTLLVLLTEVTKLLLVLSWTAVSRSQVRTWRPSLRFCFPAICYFATNLLYLLALRTTAPPLWIMLIQTRTFYTAAAYLVVFGREVSWAQLVGCVLVVCSLPLAKAGEVQSGRPTLLPSIILASQTAAVLSTAASIVVELLLKNDSRSFCEQQTWLYCWGSVLACLSLLLHAPSLPSPHLLLQSSSVWWCLLAVISSAVSGLCVPVIVRSLDTIAKDYLAALNNIALALLTAAIFPQHFSLSGLYLLSLLFLLCGIYLYERKTLAMPSFLACGGCELQPRQRCDGIP